MANKLNLLMKTFNVSGNDLSDLLHVDSSLVSKWRSGKRVLKRQSLYIDKIANYIMDLDKHNSYSNVCKMLSSEFDNVYTYSENELKLFIVSWLTNEEAKSNNDSLFDLFKSMNKVRSSVIYCLEGNGGRREAVDLLMDYAITNSPGLEIISITTEQGMWFSEDAKFLDKWSHKSMDFLKRGNTMRIIHPLNRELEDVATSMLMWLPLHFTGKSKGYYVKYYEHAYKNNTLSFSIFLLKEHLAIFGISSKKNMKDYKTWFTNDSTIIEEIGRIVQENFKMSHSLFKRYNLNESKDDFLNDIIMALDNKRSNIYYNTFFELLPYSKELMIRIFNYNNISKEQMNEALSVFNTLAGLNMTGESYYLINLQILEERSLKKKQFLNILSLVFKKPIFISNELFCEMMKESIVLIRQNQSVSVGLADDDAKNDLKDLTICADGEEAKVCVSNYKAEEPEAMSIFENTVAMSLFYRLKKIWGTIPGLKRSKEYVLKKISDIVIVNQDNENNAG